jgi:hypothetical protein
LMNWFLNGVGRLPDELIMLAGAVLTALVALVVAAVARRLLFAPGHAWLAEHGKLAELVHGSMLAFTVFVLALVLSDVRSNIGKADDNVLREASMIARLDLELEILGGADAMRERKRLRDYVRAVTLSEWAALGEAEAGLSQEATRIITSLLVGVRAVAAAQPDAAATLRSLLDKLHDLRQGRLESATKTVPQVFWWMIIAFLLGAMALNGRHPLDRGSVSLITLHMAAVGLVLALILVMDEPFRGETAVSAAPIARALNGRTIDP